MIKVFVSDIDETILLPGSKYATREVEDALITLQKKGITLILATARVFAGVEKLIEQFQMEEYGGYIVCSNGSYLYDCKQKKCLYKTTIPMNLVHELYDFSQDHGLNFCCELHEYNVVSGYDAAIEFDWKAVGVNFYLPGGSYLDAITEEPLKVAFTYDAEQLAKKFPLVLETFGNRLTVQLSLDIYIDMVPFGTSKASGIETILELLNFKNNEVAAIGDGNNDIPMFELVGMSAAVDNASDFVKKHANTIVASCENNGVAEFAKLIHDTKS